ncbi:hypothetical protein GOODEAATRI_018522, partial [Goodea atripinnis]
LSPENAEDYIDYLRSVGRLDEAAVRLAAIVNDESFVSKEGKSNYQARDVYEEAILTVVTVRDFTQVFDSYAQFEESMIAAKMETTAEMGQEEEGLCYLGNIDNTSFFHSFTYEWLNSFPASNQMT